MQNSPVNIDHYDELTARQIGQYKDTEVMHDLPLIYDYWAARHISGNCKQVTGYQDIIDFYTASFIKSLTESGSTALVSIGSGDCSIEISIVKRLKDLNAPAFFFHCLELSPILIEKANQKIKSEGLEELIGVAEVDINKWQPEFLFAGVMAHHALHHFLNLEDLFSLISDNLAPHGRFVSCDLIGRNGHMRWPEAEELTHEIWNRLPRKYKYNHLYKRYDDYFENRDCSTEGFEGIRAQDILPLLLKRFSFEVFFCYGNLVDPFIDRGFGPNFNPGNRLDCQFIDYVQAINEELIDGGILKPTSMVAVMMNEKPGVTKAYKNWTPEFVVRYPEATAPQFNSQQYLNGIPYSLEKTDDPLRAKNVSLYRLGDSIVFRNQSVYEQPMVSGQPYLMYGWSDHDADATWSTGERASVLIPLETNARGPLLARLKFMAYQSPLFDLNTIDVYVNGTKLTTLEIDNRKPFEVHDVDLSIAPGLVNDAMQISFYLPNRRQPQYESGDDLRPLGIALVLLEVKETQNIY